MILSSHPMPDSSRQMPSPCTPTLRQSQPFWKYLSICSLTSPLLITHTTLTHLLLPLKSSSGTITSITVTLSGNRSQEQAWASVRHRPGQHSSFPS
ncbi:hypothetical protein ACHAXN_010075 [Cyclotella atomus]